jgi:hypothetical protein
MQLKWMNAGRTIIQMQTGPNSWRVVEPESPDWAAVSQRPDIEAYQPLTSEEILVQERARMVCSPAQMRIALHRAGLLATVQAIADADPEASIVWEYATQVVRQSPLIDALGKPNGFTAEQIDDLFRDAMAVSV